MFESNPAVVHRFAEHFPQAVFPATPDAFRAWQLNNQTDAMQLRTSDPELYSLLAGEAPAGLLSSVLFGSFSPCKPDVEADANAAL